jgi:hypothetical protein
VKIELAGAKTRRWNAKIMSVTIFQTLLLLPILLVFSCKRELHQDKTRTEQLAKAKEIGGEFHRVETIYRTGDIRVAEQTLLAHRENLLSKQRAGVKDIDYGTALGMVDGRLFLIYRHLGDSNQAGRFFRLAVDDFNSRRRKYNLESLDLTSDALAEKLAKEDLLGPVRWKTNSPARHE